jgi:hypothetical protein
MHRIPHPEALEERIAATFEQLGELTETEQSEIRHHQTSLAQALVDDVDAVVREHRATIDEQHVAIKGKWNAASADLAAVLDKMPGRAEEREQVMRWAKELEAASESAAVMAEAIESSLRDYAHLLTHGTPRR